MKPIAPILACLAGGLSLLRVAATPPPPGTLDESFRPALDDAVRVVVPLAEGKILIGGAFRTVNGERRWGVARLYEDGRLDPDFDASGGLTGDNGNAWPVVNALLVQEDGRVLVGGALAQVGKPQNRQLLRLQADGAVDETFLSQVPVSLSGAVTPPLMVSVDSLAAQADGRILVGRSDNYQSSDSAITLLRLNPDGSRDAGFSAALNGWTKMHAWFRPQVQSIIVLTNQQILIQGYFTTVNGNSFNGLTRLYSNGRTDTNFANVPRGNLPFDSAYDTPPPSTGAVLCEPDGRLLLGCGDYHFANWRRRLVRLNANGERLADFDVQVAPLAFTPLLAGGYHAGNAITALLRQPDGSILVSGSFDAVQAEAHTNLVRLDGAGWIDARFNPSASLDQPALTMARQANGATLLGGTFRSLNGVPQAYLGRLWGDDPTPRSPTLLKQPLPQTVLEGEPGPVAFWVGADGPALGYEWRHDGEVVPDASGPSLLLTQVPVSAAGRYSVRVTNDLGEATSPEVILRVVRYSEALNLPDSSFASCYGYWAWGFFYLQVPGPGWELDTETVRSGPFSLRTRLLPSADQYGILPQPARAILETTLPGPGRLSFYHKGETNSLGMMVNGLFQPLPVAGPADANGWFAASLELSTEDPQKVAWVWPCFTKSWLADVRFVPATPAPPTGSFRFLSETLKGRPPGSFSCGFTNTDATRAYRIEWSADLKTWHSNSPPMTASGWMVLEDPALRPATFYRAVSE